MGLPKVLPTDDAPGPGLDTPPDSEAMLTAAVNCLPMAPMWARALALLVDRLIVMVTILAASVPTFYAREELDGAWQVVTFVLFFLVLAMAVLYAYARDGVGGQSIGRRLLGQQVVNTHTGKPIGPGGSFKRELILHLLLPLELVLLLAPDAHGRRQRLGDRWACTVVVKLDR